MLGFTCIYSLLIKYGLDIVIDHAEDAEHHGTTRQSCTPGMRPGCGLDQRAGEQQQWTAGEELFAVAELPKHTTELV